MKTKVRIKLPNGYYQPNTVWLEQNPEKAYKWGANIGRRIAQRLGAEIEEVKDND
jgi:hypothetical protein